MFFSKKSIILTRCGFTSTFQPSLMDVRRGKGCGENNSQFGTCWIYHEAFGSKKIKKEDLFSYIDQGWIKGRKKNNLVD